jgi:hypothetical protein
MTSENLLFIKNHIINEIDSYYQTFSGIYLFAIYKKNKWVLTYGEFKNLTSSILDVANDNHIDFDYFNSNFNIPKIIPLTILFSEESLSHLIPNIDKYIDNNNFKLQDNGIKPISEVYDKFVRIGKSHSNIILFETNIYNMNQKNVLMKGDFHISFWIDRPIIQISENFDESISDDLKLSNDEKETGFYVPKNFKSLPKKSVLVEDIYEPKLRILGNKNKIIDDYNSYKRIDDYNSSERFDNYNSYKRLDNYNSFKKLDNFSSNKKLCILRI